MLAPPEVMIDIPESGAVWRHIMASQMVRAHSWRHRAKAPREMKGIPFLGHGVTPRNFRDPPDEKRAIKSQDEIRKS